jgi:hypothetical protein
MDDLLGPEEEDPLLDFQDDHDQGGHDGEGDDETDPQEGEEDVRGIVEQVRGKGTKESPVSVSSDVAAAISGIFESEIEEPHIERTAQGMNKNFWAALTGPIRAAGGGGASSSSASANQNKEKEVGKKKKQDKIAADTISSEMVEYL